MRDAIVDRLRPGRRPGARRLPLRRDDLGGLFRGLDRVTATRLSFFLSIPALLAAGLYELKDASAGDIGVGQTIVGDVVAFVVAYAAIAWLLRFVAHHSIAWFVPYRVALGLLLLALLATGALSAT